MAQIESPRLRTESPRSSERFPMAYPVIYGGAPFVGEGSLLNLSLTGCSVASHRTVLAGSYIRLNVVMPDQISSLSIELGKVRWVRNDAFGVEFIRLPMLSAQRLDRVIWERFIQSLPKCIAKHLLSHAFEKHQEFRTPIVPSEIRVCRE